MQHATQVELSRRLLNHIAAGTTDRADAIARNDIAAFTCPERLDREWQLLFLGRPQYVGLSCLIREPGDYLTNDDLGIPLLITRDHDGRLRGFLNVCRHRGARLVEGQGRVRRGFTCPYHAWTYRTDGSLAAIPDRRNFKGVAPSEHGLREIGVAEHNGMIWVAPRSDVALDMRAVFEGLDAEIGNYQLDRYHHYATRALRWKMNWKIAVDTFLEPYHFPALHKDTVGPIFFPNICAVDAFGDNIREVLPRRGIVEMNDRHETEWDLVRHSAIIYVLFPNIVAIAQIDHFEIWRIYPVAGRVDECMVYLEFYIPEPVTSEKARIHWDKNLDLTVRTVETEDFPAGEGIQSGMLSGAQQSIVYGRNEPALQLFEHSVTARVAGAESRFNGTSVSGDG